MTTENTPNIPGPVEVLPRGDRHLRNRPFLMINIIRRPAKGVRTEKKGWTEVTGNWESFESPSLSDRVNAVHLRNANVIIDVMRGTVVKNSFALNNTDEEVVNYYLNKYRQQVAQAMDVWLTDIAKKQVASVAAEAASDGVYSLA